MPNFYRSSDEKVIAGVCAGIARRLDGGALRAGMTGWTGETGVGTLGTEATFARHARCSGPAGHPAASPARPTSLAVIAYADDILSIGG